jgi:hypothetical protein
MPPWTTARVALSGLKLARLGLVLLAAVGFGVVQTVRLEGFKVWPFKVEGALAKVDRLEGELQAILAAQAAAEKLARAQKAANEAAYRRIAEGIDDAFEENLDGELAAAARFIAANRVRCPTPARGASRTIATAGDSGAESLGGGSRAAELDAAGGDPVLPDLVAVPADDVRICTVNTLKAEAGHRLATELKAASRPD